MAQTKPELSKMKKDELIIKLMESEKEREEEREKLESFGIRKIDEIINLEDKVSKNELIISHLKSELELSELVVSSQKLDIDKENQSFRDLKEKLNDFERAVYSYKNKVNEALSGINLLTEAGQGFYIENNINF